MSHFDNQSKSFIDKTTDSKLHWNKEINDNEIDNKSTQVNGKRMLNDGKRISIHKRSSVFSIFGARNRRYSERLLHPSYPTNDRNE